MNTSINDNDVRITGRVNDFLNFFKTNFQRLRLTGQYIPAAGCRETKIFITQEFFGKKKNSYSFDRLNNKIDELFDDCNAYLTSGR
jgi:hypothetical protein